MFNQAKVLEILYAYNQFWSSAEIESGLRRDLLSKCISQLDSKEIIVLKGVRRSGKSTLLAQVIRHLLNLKINPKSIFRINLEEPLFSADYSVELLEQIYQTYRERIQPTGKSWLFLDEIQNIPQWERWVRSRSESEDIKIFITGSSSKLLSREIGTALTGRQISFEVFPLSFREFLQFNDIFISSDIEYLENKRIIKHHFIDYMKYGGFPEVVLKKNDEDKSLLLKAYFEDILYRDVATRYEIRDTQNLRNLAVYLLTNNARLTSINKLKKNFTISQDKTENYVSALLESYLIFQLQKFSFSLKTTLRAGFKPYAIDTGLRNRVAFSFSEDFGHLVENIVFCHLRQKFDEVYFIGESNEIDFAIKEGMNVTTAIQVWYDDSKNASIPKRELQGISGKKEHQKPMESILITNDYENIVTQNDRTIQCIPVTKYLLLNTSKVKNKSYGSTRK